MIEKNKLAMGLFIASEAIFFALLILAYVYFERSAAGGPSASNSLHPSRTAAYTVALLGSSFTLWRAERSRGRGSQRGLFGWLLATIGLGAVFLFGQGREYAQLLREHVTISSNLFGTTFFTLTGFHGLHVLIGLVALAILLGLALAGDFKDPEAPGVGAVGLYWHFVDAVWIVIFTVVYVGTLV